MPPTATHPPVPDELARDLRGAAARVDRLEAELTAARGAYYDAIADATRTHRQVDVAEVLGISRQRVSELANRAGV